MLLLVLFPNLALPFLAQSAGLVGEQESYLLTRLDGQEALSGAVMDAFLGPQPVDPDMAAAARSLLLLPANGFTAGNRNRDPNHPMFTEPVERLPKVPADPSAFRLLSPSQMERLQPGQCGTLLSGIRGAGVASQVRSLLVRASEAAADAAAATSPISSYTEASTKEEVQARQLRAREAAARVLREGLSSLGPVARGIVKRAVVTAASPAGDVLLPELRDHHEPDDHMIPDLFSIARSLDASDEAQDGI
ncbi:hypothetical protein Vafri_8159 [Volvox africanus]|nr:hypothetical protein Vafri_8159 [Volvox africanus]